jgi:hypothetical protein
MILMGQYKICQASRSTLFGMEKILWINLLKISVLYMQLQDWWIISAEDSYFF